MWNQWYISQKLETRNLKLHTQKISAQSVEQLRSSSYNKTLSSIGTPFQEKWRNN